MLVETNLATLSSENQENDDSSDSFGRKKKPANAGPVYLVIKNNNQILTPINASTHRLPIRYSINFFQKNRTSK